MRKTIKHFAIITFSALVFLVAPACGTSPLRGRNAPQTLALSATYVIINVTLLPSLTFAPTSSPTQVSTPVPPLVSHEWKQSDPLISFGGSGGDGGCGFKGYLPTGFPLLPNGQLYTLGWNGDFKTYEIETTTLSRQNTCNLLNSIDQTGFFDYDPSTYIRDPQNWFPPVLGAGTTDISVHA